jgi:hypothetical protein
MGIAATAARGHQTKLPQPDGTLGARCCRNRVDQYKPASAGHLCWPMTTRGYWSGGACGLMAMFAVR